MRRGSAKISPLPPTESRRSRKMILTKTEIEQKREDLCRVLVEINTKAALRGRE